MNIQQTESLDGMKWLHDHFRKDEEVLAAIREVWVDNYNRGLLPALPPDESLAKDEKDH